MPRREEAGTPPLRLLVTAGPTHEPIDDVRFIGNRSSGRLGIALAEAAAGRGHRTTLLLGPGPLAPPECTTLTVVRFRTTRDLEQTLARYWPDHDVLVMAAAVADFRPVIPQRTGLGLGPEAGKIERVSGGLTLRLEPTPDLLAGIARDCRSDQTLIGFALESPDRLRERALRKLEQKAVDAIVANPLRTMDAEDISATVFLRDGRVLEPRGDLPKPAFAEWLLDQLPTIVDAARTRA